MRVSLFVLLLVAAGLLAADLRPSAAPREAEAAPTRALAQVRQETRPRVVEIAFVRDGWVARVKREVPKGATPSRFALWQLFRGPSRSERRRGIRSAIPRGVHARSVRSTQDAWYVSFPRAMFAGGDADIRRLRLSQVAATLAPLGDQQYVAVSTAGRFLTLQRFGVRPGPLGAEIGEGGYRYSTRGVQRRLATLGYLDPSDVTGSLDDATEQALLAFQGWEDLTRTATVTGETQLALFGAARPRPTRPTLARHVEIFRDRGVLLMVEGGKVRRVVHTSTGAGGTTPVGDFRVYAKSLMSWSVPFQVWMPYAAYFRGGIAMHQSPDVPSYAASHGCVRLPEGEAERVYRFVSVGTPVFVR